MWRVRNGAWGCSDAESPPGEKSGRAECMTQFCVAEWIVALVSDAGLPPFGGVACLGAHVVPRGAQSASLRRAAIQLGPSDSCWRSFQLVRRSRDVRMPVHRHQPFVADNELSVASDPGERPFDDRTALFRSGPWLASAPGDQVLEATPPTCPMSPGSNPSIRRRGASAVDVVAAPVNRWDAIELRLEHPAVARACRYRLNRERDPPLSAWLSGRSGPRQQAPRARHRMHLLPHGPASPVT